MLWFHQVSALFALDKLVMANITLGHRTRDTSQILFFLFILLITTQCALSRAIYHKEIGGIIKRLKSVNILSLAEKSVITPLNCTFSL